MDLGDLGDVGNLGVLEVAQGRCGLPWRSGTIETWVTHQECGAWLRRKEVAGPSLQFSCVSVTGLSRPCSPAVVYSHLEAGARGRMAGLVLMEVQYRPCAA